MDTLFIGDTGTQIILDCGSNISTATILHIVCRKPDGTKVTWSGVLEGTNTIKYTVGTGDLDVAGVWKLQSYVDMPGWKGYGDVVNLLVSRPL